MKPTIGQRIVRGASSGMPRTMSPPNVETTTSRFSLPLEQPGLFSSFIPGGPFQSTNGSGNSQAPQRQAGNSEALGKSAAEAAGMVAGAGLGARKMLHPSTPTATPDVRPNLNIQNPRQAQKALGRALEPFMQSIRNSQLPQADRHLTQQDRDTAAGVAYSENTHATVPEHEAIISVILNRARSGQRQFVDPGQPLTVENVMQAHARRRNGREGTNQFQGVGGDNEQNFVRTHDQGSRNARTAAENIAVHGPTNRATFFIVTRDGNPPSTRQVRNPGRNLAQVGHEGSVYLYAPAPTPLVAHGRAGHPHSRSNPDHPRAA